MSQKEIDRYHLIEQVLSKKVKQREAAEALELSVRQVRRLCQRVREERAEGVIHKLRGRPSNHRVEVEALEGALCAVHSSDWEGFGPTFAQQKLEEYYGISLSKESLRRLMIQTDCWREWRGRIQHRSWRQRKPCRGMLVQVDGSDHDWFEGRGPRCTLLDFVDDATSELLHAEFVSGETTRALMDATRSYLLRHGRPWALYADQDSIFKVNRQPTVEEELQDQRPMTQYTRAMALLEIRVISAYSPQAKGRVERSFGTHQDRLVKELRLRDISDISPANRYLQERYIQDYNARYAIAPANPVDAHRSLLPAQDLGFILSIHTPRVVQNDFTVQYRKEYYQILPDQALRLHPKSQVTMVESLEGAVQIYFQGKPLRVEKLPGRPYKTYYCQRRGLKRKSVPSGEERTLLPSSPLPDSLAALQFDPIEELKLQWKKEAFLNES